MSLSYQGVEMLAELWLGNLYVYQVIITPEIGNCPPVVHCTMEKLEGRGGHSFPEPLAFEENAGGVRLVSLSALAAGCLCNDVGLQIIMVLTSCHVPLYLISLSKHVQTSYLTRHLTPH